VKLRIAALQTHYGQYFQKSQATFTRPIIVNGTHYPSVLEAATTLCVSDKTLRAICNGETNGNGVGVKARWAYPR
jgi:hypothetical protein